MECGSVLVLHGLGGMGKTQHAVQHAHERRFSYSHVLWASAETPDTLRTSLASLADVPELRIPTALDASLIDKLANARRWLQAASNWLLILDNADSLDSAKAIEHLLPAAHQGRVIVTARVSNWSPAFNVQGIDAWTENESVVFLSRRLGNRHQDPELLSELSKVVGSLPLALEQAAAYILQTQVSIGAYLNLFATNRRTLLTRNYRGMTDYRASVAATWQLSIRQLSVLPKYLLNIIACFAADPIPRRVFEDMPSTLTRTLHGFVERRFLLRALSSSNAVDLALAELANYSLVSLSEQTCRAHPLLQAVVHDAEQLRTKGYFQWILRLIYEFPDEIAWRKAYWPLRAANLLNRDVVVPSSYHGAGVFQLGDYIPHIEAVLSDLSGDDFSGFQDPVQLRGMVDHYREHLAGVATLRSVLERGLENSKGTPEELEWLFQNLDDFLEMLPRDGGGESQVFWNLRYLTREENQHQLRTAYHTVEKLANAQARSGNTATAQRLFRLLRAHICATSDSPVRDEAAVILAEALALWRMLPRQKTLDLLSTGLSQFETGGYFDRGDVFRGIELYAVFAQTVDEKARAWVWLRKAIPLACSKMEFGFGQGCGLVLQAAKIANECGSLQEASDICENTFQLARNSPKLHRHHFAFLWNARAILFRERGNLFNAARCYFRAFLIEQKHGTPSVFWRVHLLKEAADLFREAGRPLTARNVLLRSVPILEDGWATEAADIEILAGLIGLALSTLDEPQAGEKLLRQSLNSRVQRLGSNDPSLWPCHRLLGIFLHDNGQHSNAEHQFRQALKVVEMSTGPRKDAMSRLLADLIALLIDMKRDQETGPLLKRWSELQEHEDFLAD